MSATAIASRRASELRDAGRQPDLPFAVSLSDGNTVEVRRLLRVLPGKRIVGEGLWQGRHVLVKLFLDKRSEQRWAQEKVGLAVLVQADIPTPELLYAAALPGGGHVLLTAFLDAAQTLAACWAPMSDRPAGNPEAITLLSPAFVILGQLHAAGAAHNDLHFGNFLLSAGQLFAIDGDAIRMLTPGKALDTSRALSNLALLLAQLPPGWEAHQKAFLAAYASGSRMVIGDTPQLSSAIAKARRWRLNDYLGKCLRDCTLFSVQHSASRFCSVRRTEGPALDALLRDPDMATQHGKLLKNGNTSTVARVDLSDRTVVVKRYNLKGFWHAFGRLWRPSRAWHAWREGHRLRFLGIDTPEPLALVEERFGPLRRRAFLVNAFCPGANLEKCLTPNREPDAELASAIVELFKRLHQFRISHGDLKATNLLWHEGRLMLIDLDATMQHASPASFDRAWQRDRARLLRNWPADSALHRWLDANLVPADL